MIKINELMEIPIVGETYLVPCIKQYDMGWGLDHKKNDKPTIIPIHLNYHDDVENFQTISHYHLDTRFVYRENPTGDAGEKLISIEENWKDFNILNHFRPGRNLDGSTVINYYPLIMGMLRECSATETKYVKAELAKHVTNINKCPHKGFDLSQTPFETVDGVEFRICPLHSTKICRDGTVLQN